MLVILQKTRRDTRQTNLNNVGIINKRTMQCHISASRQAAMLHNSTLIRRKYTMNWRSMSLSKKRRHFPIVSLHKNHMTYISLKGILTLLQIYSWHRFTWARNFSLRNYKVNQRTFSLQNLWIHFPCTWYGLIGSSQIKLNIKKTSSRPILAV